MSPAKQFDALERVQLPPGSLHLAIGMFDGVHRGHQSVIGAAVEAARRDGGLAGVLTFWPHPSAVLRPGSPTPQLLPREIKLQQLGRLGVDFVIEHPFTPDFANTTAAAFLDLLRKSLPGLAAVYIGENFRFGRGREGDAATLEEAARNAGFAAHAAPRLEEAGSAISSSRLRELVAAGDVKRANEMLGYTYFAEGVVEQGRQLGRTLGFPTLNIAWLPALRPRFGVYLVTIGGDIGPTLPGVANYGLRPTVETGAINPRLEVHVLAPTTLSYGDKVTVRWLSFLRPERKFEGLDELRSQISVDRQAAIEELRKISAQETPNGA